MTQGKRRISTGLKVKLVIAAVLLVLAIILIMQNLDPVETQIFLWTTPAIPRALWLTLMLAMGYIAGAVSTWSYLRRR